MNERKEKKPFFQGLKEKLRSHQGTTLVELLVAMAIMTILGGAITTGMLISARSYTNSVRSYEKDLLYSTLQYIISYELEYSTSITVDSSHQVVDVQAKTYGEKEYEDDEITRSFIADKNGRIVYAIEGDEEHEQPILSKNAYPDGMTAAIEPLTYDPETHYFHVVLSIYYKDRALVDHVGFDVLNLYGTTPKYA